MFTVVTARKLTLTDIVHELADAVVARARAGKNYGVILVPEGAVSHIPELRALIAEMNALFTSGVASPEAVHARLTPWSQAVLDYLPPLIREQLFLERESSGAVQLSQISTERMLAELVGDELARRKTAGAYSGKYAAITHFFGYQARSSLPSAFDCALGGALGVAAGALVAGGHNGYMAVARNLTSPVTQWELGGVPLSAMMAAASTVHASVGGAKKASVRPVLGSAPVDLASGPFQALKDSAADWLAHERYANPGPIQFTGPAAADVTLTLSRSRNDYITRITALRADTAKVLALCRPGVRDAMLDAALTGVGSLVKILELLKEREE